MKAERTEIFAGYMHEACRTTTPCSETSLEAIRILQQLPCGGCGGLFPASEFITCWKLEGEE